MLGLNATQLFDRYQTYLTRCDATGITVDVSRIAFEDGYWEEIERKFDLAYEAMEKLEKGAHANIDEGRRVGHYWLRAPALAPDEALTAAIRGTLAKIKAFAAKVHAGDIAAPSADAFTDVLQIGIGGSALGPQQVADALGGAPGRPDRMGVHFVDNTDPDGVRKLLASLGVRLATTLVLVVSKSGGTPETRNGMVEVRAAMEARGLDFRRQAVAITGDGSKLDKLAEDEGWVERFPMWDWVGGRTSVMATVGLVPAALRGIDIDAFLDGAAKMDACTRVQDTAKNPAARLAAAWYHATGMGQGQKAMVVLPYKDRLLLLSRYLQQLVMESLGKKLDRDGNEVFQGITVYGNKGSTDQHAYVQQLRDGLNDFFATFIIVQRDVEDLYASRRRYSSSDPSDWKITKRPANSPPPPPIEEPPIPCPPDPPGGFVVRPDPPVYVEDQHTSGDFLKGFYLGTREALWEAGRESITITLDTLNAASLGALIALYERAVGLYAELININAYHQPGVEAGKEAAASVLELKRQVVDYAASADGPFAAAAAAESIGKPEAVETVHHLLTHLAANGRHVTAEGDRFKPIG